MVELKPLTLYELLSFLLSILGFVSVILTLYFLTKQTRASTEQTKLITRSMQETLFDALYSRQHELTKIFIDYPELYKYFYDGQEVPQPGEINHLERARVYAAGEYILDFFVTISNFKKHHPDLIPGTVWSSYIEMMFMNSPVLRELSAFPFYESYFQETRNLALEKISRRKASCHKKVRQ